MFSIIIPTLNNINYLKVCLDSLNKNSSLNNEILVHVSIGNDGTIDYLKQKKINYTFTDYNAGICEGVNTCLLYTSPSPRDKTVSRMPSSA